MVVFVQTVRPVLGISFMEGAQARQLGLPDGVLVLEAPPGSPAEKAGLRSTTRGLGGIDLGCAPIPLAACTGPTFA